MKSALFDRDSEPADQPRNFVQMLGIMIFNGLCQPKQALVVAHGGDVTRDNRRYRPYQVGRYGWHGISSVKPGERNLWFD